MGVCACVDVPFVHKNNDFNLEYHKRYYGNSFHFKVSRINGKVAINDVYYMPVIAFLFLGHTANFNHSHKRTYTRWRRYLLVYTCELHTVEASPSLRTGLFYGTW